MLYRIYQHFLKELILDFRHYSSGIEIRINTLREKKDYLAFINFIFRILGFIIFDYFNLDRFE